MTEKNLKDFIVKEIVRLNKKYGNKLNLTDKFLKALLGYAGDEATLKMYETLVRYDQEKTWDKRKGKK